MIVSGRSDDASAGTGSASAPVAFAAGWPVLTALAVYWLTLALLVGISLSRNDGHFIYPLDDAYIHMAIAKNAARDHVWGVTRYEFTSSTSSPLWTALLVMTYWLAGAGTMAPFVWNIAAGTLAIVTMDALLRRRGARSWLRLAVLTGSVFATALPTLTIVGMEHTLHGLVTIWLAFASAGLLASDRRLTPGTLTMLGALSALVSALRYEGALTVGVVAALFAATRRFGAAAVVLGAGALPGLVYGAWAMSHGWPFLPNSVLLKSKIQSDGLRTLLDLTDWSRAVMELSSQPHLLVLAVATLALLGVLVLTSSRRDEDKFLLTILGGATLLHAQVAATGWFFRYEAYLLMLGAAVFGVIGARRVPAMLRSRGPLQYAAAIAVALATIPFAVRGVNAVRAVRYATTNIYQQPYQVGLFLARFYPGRSVALNDIGAAAYLADVRLLDVFGLGSLEPALLKLRGEYSAAAVASLAAAKNVDIAIIFPASLDDYGGVPRAWTRVGEWHARNNVVLGGNTVAFYAVNPAEHERLAANLKRFSSELPAEVRQPPGFTPPFAAIGGVAKHAIQPAARPRLNVSSSSRRVRTQRLALRSCRTSRRRTGGHPGDT